MSPLKKDDVAEAEGADVVVTMIVGCRVILSVGVAVAVVAIVRKASGLVVSHLTVEVETDFMVRSKAEVWENRLQSISENE